MEFILNFIKIEIGFTHNQFHIIELLESNTDFFVKQMHKHKIHFPWISKTVRDWIESNIALDFDL